MNNFKILAICWSVVWASSLGVLGNSLVNFTANTMPLLQLLVGNPTQAWTMLPFYSFFVWGAGLVFIALVLRVAERFSGR
ncbi:MAG: hypothetical protein HZB23_15810 [Deltaproteobacteria bacterium]|nr:hypothetical protein [Deltaproteobacteria bacterium]